MIYKNIPSALSNAVDINRIDKNVSYYTDGKFFLEIYENGTCIFQRVSAEKKAESSYETLIDLANSPLDFLVKEMDDHNFVVQFSEKIFAIVFADEFENQKKEIIYQMEQNVSGEEYILGKNDVSKEHILIGLYARTRLLEDIRRPVLVKKITPKNINL